MGERDRGAGAAEYLGAVLLAGAILLALMGPVSGKVAQACQEAVCRLVGEQCDGSGSTAQGRDGAPGQGASGGTPSPGQAGLPVGVPTKPPIQKPVCSPDPNAETIERLNAHNDYQNKTALQSALSNGATSVEADVWLAENGDLNLMHDKGSDVGTLEEKYFQPLISLAHYNGGTVYPGRGEKFQVFVEVKDGGKPAYDRIVEQTRGLPPNVEVVLSAGLAGEEQVRHPPPNVAFSVTTDGCEVPARLDPGNPAFDPEYALHVKVLNEDFRKCVSKDNWALSKEERAAYTAFVQRAHGAGLKVRIWGGPDGQPRADKVASYNPFGGDNDFNGHFAPCFPGVDQCVKPNQQAWWGLQLAAGGDYLVTNHLGAGAGWLRRCGPEKDTGPGPTGTHAPPTARPEQTRLPSASPGPAPPRNP